MKLNINWLAAGTALVISGTSVATQSWVGAASLLTLSVLWFGKTWLDRALPERVPEPTAAELDARMIALREEMTKEIENLRGKLEIRQTRFGARE